MPLKTIRPTASRKFAKIISAQPMLESSRQSLRMPVKKRTMCALIRWSIASRKQNHCVSLLGKPSQKDGVSCLSLMP